MVRGLERRVLFTDDGDRADVVARLATRAEAGAFLVYAWARLPNHAHLLVRTGTRPLARSMGALLTGDAGACNRCHKRVGLRFQSRYKSSVKVGMVHEGILRRWVIHPQAGDDPRDCLCYSIIKEDRSEPAGGG